MALKAPLQFLILLVASWLGRRQSEVIEYLRAENRVLRAHLGRKRLRFTDAERRQLADKGKPLGRKFLLEMASLATPETILRWYRQLVAAKYDGTTARRGPAHRRSRSEAAEQLLTMARDNPSWGYTRLRGALQNVGLNLGRSTIQRILKAHGIEPAPVRGRTMPWKIVWSVAPNQWVAPMLSQPRANGTRGGRQALSALRPWSKKVLRQAPQVRSGP